MKKTHTIINQWGAQVRPFSEYAAEERVQLVKEASSLTVLVEDELGIHCMLSYGGLLGAARSGMLIDHDFDIDLVFFSSGDTPSQILNDCSSVIGFLKAHGYRISAESNGHFKGIKRKNGHDIVIEFFVAWFSGNDLYHYFSIRSKPIKESIFPLKKIQLEGQEILAPSQPDVLLRELYGARWQTPDPGFKYTMTAADWAPFEFLFTRNYADKEDKYFSNNIDCFPLHPSQFSSFFLDRASPNSKIYEFSDGSCGDTIIFAQFGHQPTMVSSSYTAVKRCLDEASSKNIEVDAHQLNVYDLNNTQDHYLKYSGLFDYVYTSSFLNHVGEFVEDNLFLGASQLLRRRGSFFLEYIDFLPSGMSGQKTDRYQRAIGSKELLALASKYGFECVYHVEGLDISDQRQEGVTFGRMILTKKTSTDLLRRVGSGVSSLVGTVLEKRGSLETFAIEPTAPGKCPVCGGSIQSDYSKPTRESRICDNCHATGRDAQIAYLIAEALGFPNRSLSELQPDGDVSIGNLSGSRCLSDKLESRFKYINTYYHQHPRLDIINPADEFISRFDLLINSEVLEHVIGDTVEALKGAYRTLKPGGIMIFSVPFINKGPASEHYPGLIDYSEVATSTGARAARLKFSDGRETIDKNPKFHGGSGNTLELRLFNRERLIDELNQAGFEQIVVHEVDRPEIGVKWGTPSRVITAQRPYRV